MKLTGKRVTVMGLGTHGGALGTIEWLRGQGARITVTDLRNKQELAASIAKLAKHPHIRLVLGEHREEDFVNADLVIRNPAVPRQSKYLQLASKAGVSVEMDSSLFFQHCPSSHIIGVTGSKGKTTTTTAIATLLKVHDSRTVAVGVEGVSPLQKLSIIRSETPVIFELSSWRLEALAEREISPHIAVVTSLYPDHLNTYSSFEEYINTKKAIIHYQKSSDIAILNYDDPLVREWGREVVGQLFWFSLEEIPKAESGVFVQNDMITVRIKDSSRLFLPRRYDTRIMPLFPFDQLPLRFSHERRNLLPALLIAYIYNMPVEIIYKEISLIHSLPHRLETVAFVKQAMYVNDSAATMPEATTAALRAFAGKTLVHILGGEDKQLSFERLAHEVAHSQLRGIVFLPGTATKKIKEALVHAMQSRSRISVASLPIIDAPSMHEAVKQAYILAQPGDVVLLSPAATSFGLFQHEFDRGNQFRKEVHCLLNKKNSKVTSL